MKATGKNKLQLPKSVLDMKFMKKTKERIEKEYQNSEAHEEMYSEAISNEMRHASGNFISESSFIYCEELLEGRLSFKGMNTEIEKLMAAADSTEPEGEMQKDVSDEVLLKKINTFQKKRKIMTTPSKCKMVKRRK